MIHNLTQDSDIDLNYARIPEGIIGGQVGTPLSLIGGRINFHCQVSGSFARSLLFLLFFCEVIANDNDAKRKWQTDFNGFTEHPI